MKEPKTPKKTIYIQCSAKTYLPLSQFRMLPNHLKDRKKKNIEKLAKLITENGFLFPIFVWQHPQTVEHGHLPAYTIFDGHGRYNALKLLEKRGYMIPDIPVVVVEATDEQQAKKKLLEVGNLNGIFNADEFANFTKDLMLDLDDLFVPNITDNSDAQEASFYPEAIPAGHCQCPKCGKTTPIKN